MEKGPNLWLQRNKTSKIKKKSESQDNKIQKIQ